MEDLCAIIRGTWVRRPEPRLPWRVLRPFEKLPWLGRVVSGTVAGEPELVLQPPGKETIRRLPLAEAVGPFATSSIMAPPAIQD